MSSWGTWSWLVYAIVVFGSVGFAGLICFAAGANHGRKMERAAQRRRMEERLRDPEHTRPAARPGTSPARISQARHNTHRMREE